MNYNKLKKKDLSNLIKKYKADLETQLRQVKSYKLSKMKKNELLKVVNDIFENENKNINLDNDDNIRDEINNVRDEFDNNEKKNYDQDESNI